MKICPSSPKIGGGQKRTQDNRRINSTTPNTKGNKAFTLVEILVVILIIGLLFVFLVPKIDTAQLKARETGVKTDFRAYEIAFEAVAKEKSGLGPKAVTGAGYAQLTSVDDLFDYMDELISDVNYYLDPALHFHLSEHEGASTPWFLSCGRYDGHLLFSTPTVTKLDPWNNNYIMDYVGLYTGNDSSGKQFHPGYNLNNGVIQVHSSGQNSGNEFETLTVRDNKGTFDVYRGFLIDADVAGYVPDVNHGTQNYWCIDYMKDASAIAKLGDRLSFNADEDDYTLTVASIDGVNYTFTTGFSTDIKAK